MPAIIPELYLPENTARSLNVALIKTRQTKMSVNYAGQFTGISYQDPRPNTLSGYEGIYYTTLETTSFYYRNPIKPSSGYYSYYFNITTDDMQTIIRDYPGNIVATFAAGVPIIFPNPDPNIWGEAFLNVVIISKERQWGYPIVTDPAIYYRKRYRKPNFFDLITGYEFDTRIITSTINIKSLTLSVNKVRIGYYRNNPFEPIPGLTSLQWVFKTIDLSTSSSTEVDVTGIVLGTLTFDTNLSYLAVTQTGANLYPISTLYQAGISSLMTQWIDIWALKNPSRTGLTYFTETRTFRKLAGENNRWGYIDPSDFNKIDTHPLFAVDDQRAYDWHIKPQSEGIGNLIMDSPRVIEIRTIVEQNKTAIAALKVNVDAIKAKVDTLTATDTSSLATSSALASVKTQLNVIDASLELLKTEVL